MVHVIVMYVSVSYGLIYAKLTLNQQTKCHVT